MVIKIVTSVLLLLVSFAGIAMEKDINSGQRGNVTNNLTLLDLKKIGVLVRQNALKKIQNGTSKEAEEAKKMIALVDQYTETFKQTLDNQLAAKTIETSKLFSTHIQDQISGIEKNLANMPQTRETLAGRLQLNIELLKLNRTEQELDQNTFGQNQTLIQQLLTWFVE